MIVSSFLQGTSIATLCDGPIRSALSELGNLWKEGPEGIAVEHHAVDTCVQALMEVRAMIAVPARARCAIGGAVERDPYILPSLMASVVLAEAGYRTSNLGPNLPAKALRAAAEQNRAEIVWRSSSIDVPVAALRADLKAVVPDTSKTIDLAVGGRGLPRAPLRDDVSVHEFGSMTELAGFAKARQAARKRR